MHLIEEIRGDQNKSVATGSNPRLDDLVDLAKGKVSKLTKAEIIVFHYIVSGAPNKIIAYKLGVSQRTVENHRFNITYKVGVKSLSSLTCIFVLGIKDCLPYCAAHKKCLNPEIKCPIQDILK